MKWISVKDQLPPEDGAFIYGYKDGLTLGRWDKDLGKYRHIIYYCGRPGCIVDCSCCLPIDKEDYWAPLDQFTKDEK